MDSPCEIWPRALEKTGYGRKREDGVLWMAHRWAYWKHYGYIDETLVVHHKCFVRACVNPLHLEQITRSENSGIHKPECRCSQCRPEDYRTTVCINGHVKENTTTSGRCRICQRKSNREYMTRSRAEGMYQ